jgi:hypothetical protein
MKTSTPKKISRREKVVDSMAKKFADSSSVTHIITTHRKRRIKPAIYIYVLIGLSVITTGFTTLLMTGRISPALINKAVLISAAPVKNSIDLLRDDLIRKKIGPDDYVLYLKDYLIRYDSLPDIYKTARASTASSEIYRALFDIWPQVSLRTRATMLTMMPHLETTWEAMQLERTK